MTNAGELRASPSPPRTPGPSRASLHRGSPDATKRRGYAPGESCLCSLEPSLEENPPGKFEFARGIEPSLDDERRRLPRLAFPALRAWTLPGVSSSGKPRCHKASGYAWVGGSVASSLRSMTNAGELHASPSPPRTPGPSRASRHRGKPRCYKQEGLRPGDRVFVASSLRSMGIPRKDSSPRPPVASGLHPRKPRSLQPQTSIQRQQCLS